MRADQAQVRPDRPTRPDRGSDAAGGGSGAVRLAAAVTGAMLAVQCLYLALAPPTRLNLFVSDDAYYYLLVARNWAANGFPSFDGVEPTNGFQPLWQLINLPFGTAADKATQLRLQLAAAAVLFHLGILGLVAGLDRLAGRGAALAFLVLAEANVLLVWTVALNGMESSLQIALLGAVVLVLARDATTDRDSVLVLGILAGLYGVSRLDGLALAPGVALLLYLRRRRLKPVLLFGALALAPALLFLGANLALTGAPLPVSAEVKLLWSERAVSAPGEGVGARLALGGGNLARLAYRLGSRAAGGYVYFAARAVGVPALAVGRLAGAVGALAVALALWRLLRGRPRHLAVLLPVVAMSAIRLAFFAWSYPAHFHEYDWYYAVELIVLLAVAALAMPPGLLRRGAAVAAALAAAVNLAGFLGNDDNRAHVLPVEEAVAFLASRPLSAGEPVGSWDAGYVAFLLDRPVANLDGLISSRRFFETVLKGRQPLGAYLERRGIRYLVNAVPPAGDLSAGFRGLQPGQYAVSFLSPVYHGPFGEPRRCAVFAVGVAAGHVVSAAAPPAGARSP